MNRDIFSYPVDGGTRYADPSKVLALLTRGCGGSLSRTIELANSENVDQARKYMEVLEEAIAGAFGVPRFDPATGEGWLYDDLVALLYAFYDWKEKKK